MILNDIVEKFGKLKVLEEREITQEYGEFVINGKDIDAWNALFTSILGPAAKPAGVKTIKDHLNLTKHYGGIHDSQTLFKKDFDDETVIAMFWPWSDPRRTTLKIGIVKR